MVNAHDTIEKLNKEKRYEDELVLIISKYFCDCLDDINELNVEERKAVDNGLKVIMEDSKKHSQMFNNLIQMVMDSGKDDF